MRGLMQDAPLTVDRLLDHAAAWHAAREIVSREASGAISRTNFGALMSDARRVSNALAAAGIGAGDRVATMGWNSGRHLAAWYGAVGIGAVLHTLNPRLFVEQNAYIANHAADRLLLADPAVSDLAGELLRRVPTIEQVVFLCNRNTMPSVDFPAVAFDDWISGQPADCNWGGFDESSACGLCYTSGTTGDPKGVLYSHRSNYLHALTSLQRDAVGLSARDTVLLIVPMYHVNAWGIVYSAPAVGAKLVLPGQQMDGASLYELIESEGVTVSAGVPTVWQALLHYVDTHGKRFSSLERVMIGGAACPESILRTLIEKHGIEVIQGWGMTETSSLGTVSGPNGAVAALTAEEQIAYRRTQGRLICGLEMKLVDENGRKLPHDGKTPGRLMIKGATVVRAYYGMTGVDMLDEEGFFDTGDVSTIDAQGYMKITDRSKDVIKSGGEWISSIEIENVAVGHPAVAVAAVVGVAHPRWDERPVLLCQLKPGATSCQEDMRAWLRGKIAKWWMPDDILFVEEIPLGATGKIDKKAIRASLATYRLPSEATL